jgi:hypothetical protein
MKTIRNLVWIVALTSVTMIGSSHGQVFYQEDFDTDATSAWTVNDPGVTDTFADFFFDYSSVGIPSAPNSGGSTRGMILQANLGNGVFGGFSVSPNGQNFTGDYKLSFDFWGNTHQSPAGAGTSNLSYFGFGTSGTFGNYPGVSDGVWFGVVADGDSSADYRVYDHDQRQFSYQLPGAGAYVAEIDDKAVHPRNLFNTGPTRDGDSAPLLRENFGGVTPPAAMQAAFPNSSLTDATGLGSMAFEWHQMEIIKEGTNARWLVDGIEIITLDMSMLIDLPGGNILFGHSDINNGSPPASSDAFDLLFTLIDNVQVSALTPAVDDADFDGDGDRDGADFLAWQSGFGINDGSALKADGDANNDGNVTAADLAVWESQFATSNSVLASSAVPEPATWCAALVAMLCLPVRTNRSTPQDYQRP